MKSQATTVSKATAWKMLLLLLFPFLVTLIERYIIKPPTLALAPDTYSAYLLKISSIALLLLAASAFRGRMYGLEVTKKTGKVIAILLVALVGIFFLFLYALKSKNFLDAFAVIHLANWVIGVFREEFILRGIIQTESGQFLKGSFLKISLPIWLATIAFSLWHLVNLSVWPWWPVVAVQMFQSIPSGIILGLIREKTGNTLITYLLHIGGDLLFFALYTLLFGKLFFSLY